MHTTNGCDIWDLIQQLELCPYSPRQIIRNIVEICSGGWKAGFNSIPVLFAHNKSAPVLWLHTQTEHPCAIILAPTCFLQEVPVHQRCVPQAR